MSDLSFVPHPGPAEPVLQLASAEVRECALRAPHLSFTRSLIRAARDDRARAARANSSAAPEPSCKLASPNLR